MTGREFKGWRERVGQTQQQIADRLRVTRTTIQNWESAATAIPEAVAVSCEVLEGRLRQETPNYGPLTLIYSDGPMFVSAYGPRGRIAMMQQEPYLTNAAALARVQQLWGADTFHNPFIIDDRHQTVWNAVELGRVVRDDDATAPTLTNLIKMLAQEIRASSALYVVSGRSMLNSTEALQRENAIKEQADELDRLAVAGMTEILRDPLRIDRVYFALQALGKRAPDSLVSNVAQALEVHTRQPRAEAAPIRLEHGQYVMDYRGCVFTWPKVPMFSGRWTINIASNNPGLLAKLGGCVVINDHGSIESAIAQAQRHVDEIV